MWKKCQVKVKEDKILSIKEGHLVGVFQQADVIPPSPLKDGHTGGQIAGPIAVVKVGSKLLRIQLDDVVMVEEDIKLYGESPQHTIFDEFEKQERENRFRESNKKWANKDHTPIDFRKKEAHSYYTDTAEMIHAYLEKEVAEMQQARLRELYSEPELSPSEQYAQHIEKLVEAAKLEQKIAEFNSIHKGGK